MRGCDARGVIRVGLALPVRRQRGTGHRGGAVLVPAALHAEIDPNAPSARCAAAHCGVLVTTADRAVGPQCPPYVPSVALPVVVSAVPLLAHLRPDRRPFPLDAGRAAADLARPWRTSVRWAGVACRGAGCARQRRLGRVVAPAGVSYMDILCSSRASCRRWGCPRRILGGCTHATVSMTYTTRIDTTTRTPV